MDNNHVEKALASFLLLQRPMSYNFFKIWSASCTLSSAEASVLFFFNEFHVRMPGFDEEWIERYLDCNFFALFQMKKSTFNKLWQRIDGPEFSFYGGGGRPISSNISLLMIIWWLRKGEVLLSVAEKFGVTISTVHKCTTKVLEKLVNLRSEYIQWPNARDLVSITEEFQQMYQYPGVVGAIDGTNINFKAPLIDQESYIDKNDKHSIKLQAVCVSNKLLTNIIVGFPGSVHDARVFRNSMLYRDISNGNLAKYFPLNESFESLVIKPIHF